MATIIDNYPASPARQRAIEGVIAFHSKTAAILAQAGNGHDISSIWLETRFH
jgi:hypothetical protein